MLLALGNINNSHGAQDPRELLIELLIYVPRSNYPRQLHGHVRDETPQAHILPLQMVHILAKRRPTFAYLDILY